MCVIGLVCLILDAASFEFSTVIVEWLCAANLVKFHALNQICCLCNVTRIEMIYYFLFFKALHHIRQIAQETCGEIVHALGRQPAIFRSFSQRLSRLVV